MIVRIALLLALLLVATPTSAAITEVLGGVQKATYTTTNPAGEDSGAVAFPSNVSNGSALIVAGVCWRGSGACSAPNVSDTQGNTYTVISGTTGTNFLWFIACAMAGSTGANTVTVNPPGGSNDVIDFAIDEFSGISSCTAEVDGGLGTGTATTSPSQSITTLAANALIVGVYTPTSLSATTITPGSGYNQIGETEDNACGSGHPCIVFSVEFQIVTAATSYSVNWTTGTSLAYGIYRASFAPVPTSVRQRIMGGGFGRGFIQ